MAFPVTPIKLPSILAGQTNGRLPASILVDTPGQAGGYTVRLVEPAARAWRALCAATKRAGFVLKASGPLDSYRPYERQEAEFRERYQTTYIAGAATKTWQGQTWYQRPGTAVAATPGTSNHGLGLAVDTDEERDGDAGPESLSNAALAWLVAHEGEYGWSHELQSEPWHIRYVAGDNIPAAVLAYERADPFSMEDEVRDIDIARIASIVLNGSDDRGYAAAADGWDGSAPQGLRDLLARTNVSAQLASLADDVEDTAPGIDYDKLAAKVAPLVVAGLADRLAPLVALAEKLRE